MSDNTQEQVFEGTLINKLQEVFNSEVSKFQASLFMLAKINNLAQLKEKYKQLEEQQLTEKIGSSGFNINAKNKDDETLLLIAVKNVNIDMVSFLLSNDANPNLQGRANKSPLHIVVDKYKEACNHGKILKEDCERIIGLLANMKVICMNEIYDNAGQTPLMRAIESSYTIGKDSLKIIDCLIKKGADVNVASERDETPLMYAIDCMSSISAEENPYVVEYLMEKGATAGNAYEGFKKALMYAADDNSLLDFIKPLIVKGTKDIDVNKKTALMHEVVGKTNNTRVAILLKDEGVDIDSYNVDGKTLLISAIKKGKMGMVSDLLKNGANPNSIDTEGKSPLEYAIKTKNTNAFELLLKAGADRDLLSKEMVKQALQFDSMALIVADDMQKQNAEIADLTDAIKKIKTLNM